MQAKKRGFEGENAAAHFLQSKGYEVLHNNFTVSGGEIDIIAKKTQCLVFIEVKTRRSDIFGEGSEAVDRIKKIRMMHAINRYLERFLHEPDWRVDIIEVTFDSTNRGVVHMEHFEDIEM